MPQVNPNNIIPQPVGTPHTPSQQAPMWNRRPAGYLPTSPSPNQPGTARLCTRAPPHKPSPYSPHPNKLPKAPAYCEHHSPLRPRSKEKTLVEVLVTPAETPNQALPFLMSLSGKTTRSGRITTLLSDTTPLCSDTPSPLRRRASSPPANRVQHPHSLKTGTIAGMITGCGLELPCIRTHIAATPSIQLRTRSTTSSRPSGSRSKYR